MYRILTLGLAALFAATTLLAASLDERARNYLSEGTRAHEMRQFDKALKSFTLARDMAKFGQINDLLLKQILILGADSAIQAGRGDEAVVFCNDRVDLAEKHGRGNELTEAKIQLVRAYIVSKREPLARDLVTELRKTAAGSTGLERQLDRLVEEINTGKVASLPTPGVPGATPTGAAAPGAAGGIVYHTIEDADETPTPAPAVTPSRAAAVAPKPTPPAALAPKPTPVTPPKPVPTATAKPMPSATPKPVPMATPKPAPAPQATPPSATAAGAAPAAAMVSLPAGEFSQGDVQGQGDEKPSRRVRISAFQIDASEVSNAAFAAFVKAAAYKPDGDWLHYVPRGGETLPVRGVSWNDARAYCEHAGKRLPTEAEWEYAARGAEGRRYAFGDTYDTQLACTGRTLEAGPCHVGTGKATPEGVYDLTGNVLEWVADSYDAKAYASSESEDPKGPAKGSMKVLRGGAWDDAGDASRASNRYSNRASGHLIYYGFRCAKSQP